MQPLLSTKSLPCELSLVLDAAVPLLLLATASYVRTTQCW
jgi:hypothetical protein